MAEEKIKKEEKTEVAEENKKPDWVKMKPAEVEKLIVELAKQGESPAKIGLILRDKHGIPKAKLLGKRISEILKEAKIKITPEKELVQKRIDILNKHIANNKHDQSAKKTLIKQLWTLKRAQVI